MRVCLLYPPRPGGRGTNLVPPIGLLYLGAVLEKAGHQVGLVDAALTARRGAGLAADVASTAPDIVMVSAFTSDIPVLAAELPGLAGALPAGTRFWLGGPHACCTGVAAMDDLREIEAVFVGEGERTVLQAMASLEGGPRPARGVIWRDDPRETEPDQIEDLAALPVPAWHLAPPGLYRGLPNGVVLRRSPYAPILTTRGCPCRCTFCAGWRITGRSVRHRPMEHVWREIELLVRDFGVREIHIEDDNFTIDRAYALEFCRIAVERRLPVLFSTPNGIRLDTVDEELARAMKRAGWYLVHCGIESGSDRILRLMKKGTDTAMILDRIRLLKRCGLPVAGYFILGVPGETREDIESTIRFARDSGLAWAHFASFLPIPGSEAGDAYLAAHRRPGEGWEFFHNTACPAPPDGMSRKDMKSFQRRAFLTFYTRPGPAIRILGLLRHRGSARRLLGRIAAYLSPGRVGRGGGGTE